MMMTTTTGGFASTEGGSRRRFFAQCMFKRMGVGGQHDIGAVWKTFCIFCYREFIGRMAMHSSSLSNTCFLPYAVPDIVLIDLLVCLNAYDMTSHTK